MIVSAVWTRVGLSNLKNCRTRIRNRVQKFWNRSGVGAWKSDSSHLCNGPDLDWAGSGLCRIF